MRIFPIVLALALFTGCSSDWPDEVVAEESSALSQSGGTETETTYYSDATRTTEVGFILRTCEGYIYRSGRITAYYERTSVACEPDEPADNCWSSELDPPPGAVLCP